MQLKKAKQDPMYLEQVYKENENLIWFAIYKIFGDYNSLINFCEHHIHDIEDFQNIAALGLIKSIKSFKPEYGCSFSTYAVPFIVGEIKRYLRDFSHDIRVSRIIREISVKYLSLLKKGYTEDEIISELEKIKNGKRFVNQKEIKLGIEVACISKVSFDSEIYSDNYKGSESIELRDKISKKDISFNDSSDEYEKLLKEIALDIFPYINDIQKKVFFYSFIDGTLIQTKIANLLGVSQVEISRTQRYLKEFIDIYISFENIIGCSFQMARKTKFKEHINVLIIHVEELLAFPNYKNINKLFKSKNLKRITKPQYYFIKDKISKLFLSNGKYDKINGLTSKETLLSKKKKVSDAEKTITVKIPYNIHNEKIDEEINFKVVSDTI